MIYNQIRGLEKVSLCDWKGTVSTVIFLGGCNFRCPTCHNWELATSPNSIKAVPAQEVMDYLASKRNWLDGVVVTGGEPTIHSDLPDLISEIKSLGFRINLHTNGSNPAMIQTLFERDLVEVFSVDVKGPWEKYPSLTGGKQSPSEAAASLGRIFGPS